MTAPPRAGERDGAASGPGRKSADPLLAILVSVNLLLFAGGAIAHAGVGIPLGVGTWKEPLLVPAAIIEGAGAAGLLITLIAVAARANWAYRPPGGSCGTASLACCGAWDASRWGPSRRRTR